MTGYTSKRRIALDRLDDDDIQVYAQPVQPDHIVDANKMVQPAQEPVAVKHMLQWTERLKSLSNHGQYLNIPGLGAGACWELANELEQFIKTAAQPAQEPPSEWALIKNILDAYGFEAISFVADWKEALAQPDYRAVKTYHEGKPVYVSQPAQEPVVWKWHKAPVKTSWGHEMFVADLGIDRDHTVSIYCERDQIAKVEAMFTTPPAAQRPIHITWDKRGVRTVNGVPDDAQPAQRPWVGLTDDEMTKIVTDSDVDWGDLLWKVVCLTKIIEAALKEKNR